MNLLQEGDVIELELGHKVYMKIPDHFIFANTVGRFDHCSQTEVIIGETKKGWDTSALAGEYIVVSTANTGGGTGHGPGDIYPDGHYVKCVHRNYPLLKVSFYQTGSFTAMITEIKPIGRATATWKVT